MDFFLPARWMTLEEKTFFLLKTPPRVVNLPGQLSEMIIVNKPASSVQCSPLGDKADVLYNTRSDDKPYGVILCYGCPYCRMRTQQSSYLVIHRRNETEKHGNRSKMLTVSASSPQGGTTRFSLYLIMTSSPSMRCLLQGKSFRDYCLYSSA